MRDRAGSAATPAARCKNVRRGSFTRSPRRRERARERHGKAEDFGGLEVDDQFETSSRYGGAPIADIARAIRYAVAASGCSTLAETDRGGTFSNRDPNPSAMVGCVRIASRSV